MKKIDFNLSMSILAESLNEHGMDASLLVIRDIQGRIRLSFNEEQNKLSESDTAILSRISSSLKSSLSHYYLSEIFFKDSFLDPDALFENPDIVDFQLPESEFTSFRLLDRQITGQDWSARTASDDEEATIPRAVFFGLKGGVGRSTALSMLAYHLAEQGKRVLLVDLDLESPGLSGLLLPPERSADYGIVDWLIEEGLQKSVFVLRDMVADSPLSDDLSGDIRVAAAMKSGDPFYLDKLSRVYADLPKSQDVERFSQRVIRLLNELENQEQPDVVLIDSRAGLHDLAALSIVELAYVAFLFATDSAQSWQGYDTLFAHWQARPNVARHVRKRIYMVDALFPEANQQNRAERFKEKAFDLFTRRLYDENNAEGSSRDLFSFDLNDDAAPHFPMRIKWNNRFQEFDPKLLAEGLFTKADIDASFGDFLNRSTQLLEFNDG